VELEFSTDNNFDSSGYLDKDHDFEDAGDDPADPFPYTCLGSSFDFDGTEDAIGLYDFRSTKSE
jgi:hypothetical protein